MGVWAGTDWTAVPLLLPRMAGEMPQSNIIPPLQVSQPMMP